MNNDPPINMHVSEKLESTGEQYRLIFNLLFICIVSYLGYYTLYKYGMERKLLCTVLLEKGIIIRNCNRVTERLIPDIIVNVINRL